MMLSEALKNVPYSILSSVWAVKEDGLFTLSSKAMIIPHSFDEPLQYIPIEYRLVCDGLYPYDQYMLWGNDTRLDPDYSWENFEEILIYKLNRGILINN